MKRVIVIVLLAIILAMLMSRRENLTPKCPAGKELIAGLCYSACPTGFNKSSSSALTCERTSCPPDKPVNTGASYMGCCKSYKNGLPYSCSASLAQRTVTPPTWA